MTTVTDARPDDFSPRSCRNAIWALTLSPRRGSTHLVHEVFSAISNTASLREETNPEDFPLFSTSVIEQISAAADTPMSATTARTSQTALHSVTNNELGRPTATRRSLGSISIDSLQHLTLYDGSDDESSDCPCSPPRKKACNRLQDQ